MDTFKKIRYLANSLSDECAIHKDNESAYLISTRLDFILRTTKEIEDIADTRRRNLAFSYDDEGG